MDNQTFKHDAPGVYVKRFNVLAINHDKPRYILDLLLSVINLSLQTLDIVDGLPWLELEAEESQQGVKALSGQGFADFAENRGY